MPSVWLQVTPVFGILNDLQKRRVAIERRDAAAGPVPDEVIFIFTAAQKNELALLQRPLIANAMCAIAISDAMLDILAVSDLAMCFSEQDMSL